MNEMENARTLFIFKQRGFLEFQVGSYITREDDMCMVQRYDRNGPGDP